MDYVLIITMKKNLYDYWDVTVAVWLDCLAGVGMGVIGIWGGFR